MQSVSDSARSLADAYGKITIRVYIAGEALDAQVGLVTYAASCGSEEAFSFGNACAAQITLVLAEALPDLKEKEIQVTWSVDDTEYPLLTGVVEHATVSAGRTTVEAWDYMYRKGAELFTATEALLTTCPAADAWQYVAELMGIEADTETLTAMNTGVVGEVVVLSATVTDETVESEAITISEEEETIVLEGSPISIPDGLSGLTGEETCSQVAGYIAGIMGGNALITRDGKLGIRNYTNTDFSTEPYSGGASAEDTDYSVTGVTLRKQVTIVTENADGTTSEEAGTEEYSAGDGSLVIDTPLASSTAAALAWATLGDMSIRPGSYSFPGGILLEPGDLFQVHSGDGTYTAAAVTLSMQLDGGCTTTTACGGEAETSGATGQINQAMAALQLALARFQKLYADNATITSANIETLKAGKIYSNAIELIPKTVSGEETVMGKLVLAGYDTDGNLTEKLSLEVYPYQQSNLTPAVIRAPAGVVICQEDQQLLQIDSNEILGGTLLNTPYGLRVGDGYGNVNGIIIFNKYGGVTTLNTSESVVTGTLTVSGNVDHVIGDETKFAGPVAVMGKKMTYDAGDSLSINLGTNFAGAVVSSKAVRFTIPLCKPVSASTVTLSGKVYFRGVSGRIYTSGASETYLELSGGDGYTVTPYITGDGFIRVYIVFDEVPTNAVTDTVACATVYERTATITFS